MHLWSATKQEQTPCEESNRYEFHSKQSHLHQEMNILKGSKDGFSFVSLAMAFRMFCR